MGEVSLVGRVHAPAGGMFIVQLHQNHRAAMVDLVSGDNRHDLLIPGIVRSQKLRLGDAESQTGLEQKPFGIAAVVPFRADIHTCPHGAIKTEVVDFLKIKVEILLAGKIINPFRRRMVIHEDIRLHAVQAGAFEP